MVSRVSSIQVFWGFRGFQGLEIKMLIRGSIYSMNLQLCLFLGFQGFRRFRVFQENLEIWEYTLVEGFKIFD